MYLSMKWTSGRHSMVTYPRPLHCCSWACPRWTGVYEDQGSALLTHALASWGHAGLPLPKCLVAKVGAQFQVCLFFTRVLVASSPFQGCFTCALLLLPPQPTPQRGAHSGGEIKRMFTFWQLKTEYCDEKVPVSWLHMGCQPHLVRYTCVPKSPESPAFHSASS